MLVVKGLYKSPKEVWGPTQFVLSCYPMKLRLVKTTLDFLQRYIPNSGAARLKLLGNFCF